MNKEEIEQLVDRMLLTLKYAEEPEWKILYEYIEELQQRINKAIEYIEDWLFDAGGNGAEMPYEDIDDLLEILKGE